MCPLGRQSKALTSHKALWNLHSRLPVTCLVPDTLFIAPATQASFSPSNEPYFFPPQDLRMCCFLCQWGLPPSPFLFRTPPPPPVCLARSQVKEPLDLPSQPFPDQTKPDPLPLTCIVSSVFPSWPLSQLSLSVRMYVWCLSLPLDRDTCPIYWCIGSFTSKHGT